MGGEAEGASRIACLTHPHPPLAAPCLTHPHLAAALSQFSKSEYGLDETQANIATALSAGIGLYAAVEAAKGFDLLGKCSGEDKKSSGI